MSIDVARVIIADALVVVVINPRPFAPVMVLGQNYPAVLFNFLRAIFIGEVLAAAVASPVCTVTRVGAGGSHSVGLGQSVFGQITIYPYRKAPGFTKCLLRVYLYSGRKVLFVGCDGFTDQLCGGERLAAAQIGLKRSTRWSQPRFMYVLKPAAD